MNCMKCSRETEAGEVFCKACLESMASAPIKPGTPVTIPKRPKKNLTPAPKKQQQEEVEAQLNQKIQRLQKLSIGLAMALCLSVGLLVWHFFFVDHSNLGLNIGQNYSTETQIP